MVAVRHPATSALNRLETAQVLALAEANLGQILGVRGSALDDLSRFKPKSKVPAASFQEGVGCLLSKELPDSISDWMAGPAVLFGYGDLSLLSQQCISIVGTRNASAYGRAAAMKFAEVLASAGLVVVSGGAIGVDAVAHEGALNVGGKTVAVMGGGVDRIYPAVNRKLFERIRESGGCLVSQFGMGVSPLSHRFIQRDYLIAALSMATLVIEAPQRSGSLITANAANGFGRQVFVVPGQISAPGFKGSHDLIRDGATLVDHPDQILDALNIASQLTLEASLPGPHQRIIDALSHGPLLPEILAENLEMPLHEVLAQVTDMEMEGLIYRDGPKLARQI